MLTGRQSIDIRPLADLVGERQWLLNEPAIRLTWGRILASSALTLVGLKATTAMSYLAKDLALRAEYSSNSLADLSFARITRYTTSRLH